MVDALSDLYATLAELRDHLPRLRAAMVPGTAHRWVERDLSAAQRERQDAQALQERAAKELNARRGFTALGDAPAPLDLSALDTLIAIEAGLIAIEAAVVGWLGMTARPDDTARQRITRLIGLIDRITAIEELSEWVEDEAARLHRHARRALGDSEPVHKIRARCPICNALSLRSFTERELVVCCNDQCQCDDQGCGCKKDRPRRHRWNRLEWPWLAQVLDDELREQAS